MNILTPSTSTNRPTSEHVLHPKAFQSWRWVFLAAILLATVAITTFYFSSAQAQNADGAIAGLTLTSTTAGTLTVSWDAASPTPTDYRVDWAKSTEDYKSWKVDDGHVYTTPETATTTTITDLSHDTEYKIRMRARYYRGEHEGKSWAGPWAEATITVAGEPARRPPLNLSNNRLRKNRSNSRPGMTQTRQQEPSTHSRPPTTTPASSCSRGKPQRRQTPRPRTTTSTGPRAPRTIPPTQSRFERERPSNRHHAYADGTRVRYRLQHSGSGPATATARTPPAPGTGRGPRRPPRSSCRSQKHRSSGGHCSVTPIGKPLLTWFNSEETHTYAVKARNASGLSPLSNTLTATVPAAELPAHADSFLGKRTS